ncbi:MAG: phosphate signaling complex protein PhoU [Beijerinckiaceae bacterium]|nr:phosphate signaling complex protein PhoU [Beijerinckiaceae bacterium]
MSEHIVKSYDAELKSIIALLSQMGAISLQMLSRAMDSLAQLDAGLARSVVETDPRLDALQREIEDKAVATIARRQPMAVDLRELVGAIRIAGDLERTGDLAKNIAKRAIVLGVDDRVPRLAVGLKHMSDLAARQLRDVLEAFEGRDIERAHAVWTRDSELDALEDSVFRDLLTFMMEDPRNISFCIHLLFCSKNIERIGDHATNIAETVHYIATGMSLPVNRPKGADSGSLPTAG